MRNAIRSAFKAPLAAEYEMYVSHDSKSGRVVALSLTRKKPLQMLVSNPIIVSSDVSEDVWRYITAPTIWLSYLAVHPDYQGQGHGRAHMNFHIGRAHARGQKLGLVPAKAECIAEDQEGNLVEAEQNHKKLVSTSAFGMEGLIREPGFYSSFPDLMYCEVVSPFGVQTMGFQSVWPGITDR